MFFLNWRLYSKNIQNGLLLHHLKWYGLRISWKVEARHPRDILQRCSLCLSLCSTSWRWLLDQSFGFILERKVSCCFCICFTSIWRAFFRETRFPSLVRLYIINDQIVSLILMYSAVQKDHLKLMSR